MSNIPVAKPLQQNNKVIVDNHYIAKLVCDGDSPTYAGRDQGDYSFRDFVTAYKVVSVWRFPGASLVERGRGSFHALTACVVCGLGLAPPPNQLHTIQQDLSQGVE